MYAAYYDLLNAGKDYDGEAAYVHRLLGSPVPGATVLELGCGTGLHAAALAARGLEVTGVDRSGTMLEEAQRRMARLPRETASRLSFVHGDAGTYRANRAFDAVISLFHVVSYQTEQSDLEAMLATARAHLGEGGTFLFDSWYGPAVLTDRPERRTKRFENDALEVTRLAEPRMHPNENVVDVEYDITIRDKATGRTQQIRETHRMRYLFVPELEVLLRNAGFALEHYEEWMTGRPADFDTWGVCFVAKAL